MACCIFSGVYAITGLVLALIGAFIARRRSRASSFYDAQIYHMTSRSHRAFAGVSVAFAGVFVIALRVPVLTVPALAVYTLLLILYGSSFVRGFSDEHE